MQFINKHFHISAGILMAIIFLVSGIGKLATVEDTQAYMEAYGVPGILIYPAAAFEIASGIALLSGYLSRYHSILLAGWCLLTASIFHTDFEDPNQRIHLMKNLVMGGGFLVLARAVGFAEL